MVWENELRTELIVPASGKVRSYDLDGKLLWELEGMTFLTAPSPFAKHGLVYFSSGISWRIAASRLRGSARSLRRYFTEARRDE